MSGPCGSRAFMGSLAKTELCRPLLVRLHALRNWWAAVLPVGECSGGATPGVMASERATAP